MAGTLGGSISTVSLREASLGESEATDVSEWTDVQRRPRKPKSRYITRERAFALQKELDIVDLAGVLTSIPSRNLQADGWGFDRILRGDGDRPEDVPPNTDLVEFIWLAIPNKWGDRALFSRRL